MTITLIDSANRAEIITKNDALDLKSDKETKSDGFEFGQLMANILETRKSFEKMAVEQIAATEAAQQSANGQEVAAQTKAMNMVIDNALTANLPGQDFLKTVILGPHLNAITPETSLPDEQSLEAFARSQGLDETAVQWLMGSPSQAPVTALIPAVVGLNPSVSADLTDGLASAALTKNSSNDHLMGQLTITSGKGQLPNGISNMDVTEVTKTITKEITNDVSTMFATGVATNTMNGVALDEKAATTIPGQFSLNPLQKAVVDPATISTVNRSDAPSNGGLLTSAALWALAQHTEKTHAQAPKTDNSTEANDLQIHFMRTPPPAAVWMIGNTQVNSPIKETLSPKNNITTSELDLTELASDELLTKLIKNMSLAEPFEMDAPADLETATLAPEVNSNAAPGASPLPLSGHTGQRMDLATTARQESQNTPPSNPEASTAERSENAQNLSEKMGQAVGQRILSAIEKGQWHLKLMLRPATLGHIEVEIRMRSGELDTVFTAPQALTRELLQDGLSKLKDSLGQMGMNVASMLVGDGQTQQRGGDSTPSQTRKMANSDSKESKSAETQQINIPRTKMGKDGWDVLV